MAKSIKTKPLLMSAIPSDWEVLDLNLLGKFSKGKGILKEQVIKSGLPCIRYGEIYTTHDFVIKKFKSFINEDVAKESQQIKSGDILFAGSGEKLEEIGKAVAFIGNEKAYAGGDVIILSANNKVNVEFLVYSLEGNYLGKQKRRLGQGHSVVHIYARDLATLKIPLPPLGEQKSIANILCLLDTAIDKTNSLITKKELQKKWLMQNLLTGKKRIKGFREKWKEVRLKQVGELITGLTYSPEDIREEGILVLRSSNIQNGELAFENNVYVESGVKFNPVKVGDILICVRNGSQNLIGKSVQIDESVSGEAFGAFMTVFSSSSNFFLRFFFQSDEFILQVKRNLGATINSINNGDLLKYKVLLPPENEQNAISEILQAADKEIQLLKTKRDKLKEKKKGLMQILLTGKKRLKTK